jgi:hypothetical protein
VLLDRTARPLIKQFDVVGYPTKLLIDNEGRVMRPAVKNVALSLELIAAYLERKK